MSNEQQHMLGRSQRMQDIERVRNTRPTVQISLQVLYESDGR